MHNLKVTRRERGGTEIQEEGSMGKSKYNRETWAGYKMPHLIFT